VALLCAATVLAEALSPVGVAFAAAKSSSSGGSAAASVAAAATTTNAGHPSKNDPLRAFVDGLFGGGERRRQEEEEARRRLERERLEAEAAAAEEAAAAAARARSARPWWARLLRGRGRGGGGGGASTAAAAKRQPAPLLTAMDLADLLGLDLDRAEQLIAEEQLPPAALRLGRDEARRRVDALARALGLGPPSARALVARAPALLALEPARVRARVDRELPRVLGVPRERALEAARASPGLLLAGARLGDVDGNDPGQPPRPQQQDNNKGAATLEARLRALGALLEVPEPVARGAAARAPELLALPRVDLAGRLALLARVLSEPERAETTRAVLAAEAAEPASSEEEEQQQQQQQQQQQASSSSSSSSRRSSPSSERRSRTRARARLEAEARELRARDAARRLPPLSEEGLARARAAALEQPALLSLAGRPTALRLRAREAAALLGLSDAQLCDAVVRPGGSALLAQPAALTRARLLAVAVMLDANPLDAADAVARNPALVAVSGDELAARLGAVSEALGVPLARARTLALERPSLLARDARTIRAAGELVGEAARKARKQSKKGGRGVGGVGGGRVG